MQERLGGVYDAMIIAHDTRKNLEDNKDRLAPFELVVSTDTGDLLYKDEQGNISGFFGGGGDINEQIKAIVDKNVVDIADHEGRITSNTQAVNNITSTVNGKLDKGGYDGTAETLNRDIQLNTSTIGGKLDKGGYEGTAQDLNSKTELKLDKGSFNGTADDFLLKTGGAISGPSATPLTLRRTTSAANLNIAFENVGHKMYLGTHDGSKLKFGASEDQGNNTEIPTDKESLIYGIGHTGSLDRLSNSLDTISKSGFYRSTTGSTGNPFGETAHILHMQNPVSSTFGFQIAATANSNLLMHRTNKGGWLSWTKIWTDALTKIGDSANGYIRFPNGFQICWGGIATGTTTVTFPMAFTKAPLRLFVLPSNANNTSETSINWNFCGHSSVTTTGATLLVPTTTVTRTFVAIGF